MDAGKYRLLFDNMLNGFAYHRIVLDDSGRPVDHVFLEINDAFERLTGLKRENVLGCKVTEALPGIEKDPADWIGRYGRVALMGEEARFEQYSEPLGMWYSVIAYRPEPEHFAVIFENITGRKEAEEHVKHLNAVLRGVRNVNQLITRRPGREELLAGACRSLVEARGYPAVWIVLLDEDRRFVAAAEAGLGGGFAAVRDRLVRGDLPECCEKALDSSGAVAIDDPTSRCSGCAMDKERRGSAALAVRLEYGAKTYGVMVIEVPAGIPAGPEEVSLLQEAAGDIAFALHGLDIDEARRLAEEALRESEHQKSLVLDNTAEIIGFHDTDHRIQWVNNAYLAATGLSLEKLRGQKCYEAWGLDRLCSGCPVAEATKTGKPCEAELTPQNQEHWPPDQGSWLSRAAPVRDSAGAIVGAIEVAYDITERKRTEEVLREREAQYRDLTENMNDMVQSVAPDGSFIYVNRAWRETLGYSEDEVRGLSLWDVVHLEEEAHCRELFDRVMSGENVQFIKTRFVAKDGRTVEVEGGANCRMADGKPAATRGIFRDVTARRLAENERRESEERYRDLVEATEDLVQSVRPDGSIAFVNRAWRETLGYSEKEAQGLSMFDIIHPESREHCAAIFQRVLAGETASNIEAEFLAKDGRTVLVEGSASSRLVDGKPVATYGIFHDVTERREAERKLHETEEQLRQSQKLEAIGRLAGGIAHDFNNMLGAIIGYSDVILRDLRREDPLSRDIEQIKAAADRAAGLTRQLLAFSRKQVLEPRVINLNSVVTGLEKMLRRLIGEDIELSTALADGVWHVRADPGQVEQVIMNLAVNSRDAMRTGGKLTIETANVHLDEEYARGHVAVTPGPHVMLAVSDTGCGMDEKTKARLFEPFFTTKEAGKGTGLGLSTVYGIVKQSGGNIWVYSEPGKGTTFKVYLPKVTAETEAIRVTTPEKAPRRGTETVLVVEDEPVLRRLVARMLTLAGYKVIEAANGGEALLACEKRAGEIALMVTDVVMPGMSGRELADRLRKLRPDVRVLYTSGYTDNAIVHHGVLDPGAAFIQKPFSASALAAKVREVLDAPARHA